MENDLGIQVVQKFTEFFLHSKSYISGLQSKRHFVASETSWPLLFSITYIKILMPRMNLQK